MYSRFIFISTCGIWYQTFPRCHKKFNRFLVGYRQSNEKQKDIWCKLHLCISKRIAQVCDNTMKREFLLLLDFHPVLYTKDSGLQ